MAFCALALLGLALPGAADADADVAVIRERLVARYVPSSPGEVTRIRERALGFASAMGPDGSWPDIDYADQARSRWLTSNHLTRLLDMLVAFRAGGEQEGADSRLREAADSALDFWLEKDPHNPNWWWNEIGPQLYLGPALILFGDELTPAQRAQGLAVMQRTSWEKWTGQNLVWGATIQIMRGCIENDPAVIQAAYDRMYGEIGVVPPGKEGIQADYSFHQHGPQLYSGGYGLGFAANGTEFLHHARGTRFAAPPDILAAMTGYVLDGQQWMMRAQTFDYSATGREITRPGKSGSAMIGAAARLAESGSPRAAELEAYVARMKSGGREHPLTGNRHFWRSDYMAHHRPGYFASVRMASSRNLRSELVNSEGPRSHHLADGVLYLYQTGLEYRDIFPVWDWQRVPGTTVEQMDWAAKGKVGGPGETAFAGGVSDAGFGLAAMDFRRGALGARKAWFFFDEAIVCLGAGIACASANPVVTSVNQCLLNGPVRVSGRVDPLETGRHELAGPCWIHHDGAGYLFPGEGVVYVANEAQAGQWSDIGAGSGSPVSLDVFSVWLDHGSQASGGGYAYIMYPGIAAEACDARAASSASAILANTPALQAVEHTALGIVQAAFYEPGSVTCVGGQTLSVDRPCLVQLRAAEQPVRAAVSNPVNEPLEVTVAWADSQGAVLSAPFSLPDGPMAGSNVVNALVDTAAP